MRLSERLRGLVLEPEIRVARVDPPREVDVAPAAARIAVLAPAREVLAVSCAAAMALPRSGVAVVATWGQSGDPPTPAGALGRGHDLATRLCSMGFEAVAAGRVVRVVLPGEEVDAATEARRLSGCCECPVVFGIGGARGEELSLLLRQVDRVLIARTSDVPAGLLDLATGELTAATVIDVRLGAPLRSGFSLGYGVSPRLTRQLRDALA